MVAQAGNFSAVGWVWNSVASFCVRGSNSEFLWQELSDNIQHIVPLANVVDAFAWNCNAEGVFIVKSCYDWFKPELSDPTISAIIAKAAAFLWKIKAPPKILFFGWKVIHNILATKDQLINSGMFLDPCDHLCVFCLMEVECLPHILGGCSVVSNIWRKVYELIGSFDDLTLEEFEGFFSIAEKLKNKEKNIVVSVIWLATAWCIWNRRNTIIFINDSLSFRECMSEVIFSSWSWLLSYYKLRDLCNFHT
ncbi:uncharacterized protein LOC131597952 [Vicia villosa]|uniref:uncharacterized protein LOC131597952 n=1 Tax=Vicia villosa TaxID=3911 RepID=UPI00273CCEDA|nr:uncharacterized protein LOC131597952 [Vicia villosa]